MTTSTEIRPSPIAGTWYSGSPERLAAQVDAYLQHAHIPALNGRVVALISPHAGHRYSGRTAAHAFRCVQGQTFDLVAVVSPLHDYARAALLTSAHSAYATPLGSIPVDAAAVQALNTALQDAGEAPLTPVAHDHEHSLEIELPFLQRALSGAFNLLPVMVRSQAPHTARALGHALAAALHGRSALLVASTDLSHFYPLETANQLDGEMLKRFASLAPEQIFEAEMSGVGRACGAAPTAAVLWAARELGANTVEILHHSTSAEETGDHSSVVGYGAAVVLQR